MARRARFDRCCDALGVPPPPRAASSHSRVRAADVENSITVHTSKPQNRRDDADLIGVNVLSELMRHHNAPTGHIFPGAAGDFSETIALGLAFHGPSSLPPMRVIEQSR